MKNKGLIKMDTALSKGGLKMAPDGSGYAVDWTELPASDHFFLATHTQIQKSPTNLRMLFGSISAFDEEAENFDLAVEIHFPLREAGLYLNRSVFDEMSGNGKWTFFESIEKFLSAGNISIASTKSKTFKLPANRTTNFRLYPANFAGLSFSGTQGLIEFYEVPPELVHFARHGKRMRPQSGVKPVISIIMDTLTMFNFLRQTKECLGNYVSEDIVEIKEGKNNEL